MKQRYLLSCCPFPYFPIHIHQRKTRCHFKSYAGLFLFGLSFIALKGIYDHFSKQRWGYGITGFVTNSRTLEKYNKSRLLPIRNAFVKASEEPRLFFLEGVQEMHRRDLPGNSVVNMWRKESVLVWVLPL